MKKKTNSLTEEFAANTQSAKTRLADVHLKSSTLGAVSIPKNGLSKFLPVGFVMPENEVAEMADKEHWLRSHFRRMSRSLLIRAALAEFKKDEATKAKFSAFLDAHPDQRGRSRGSQKI